MVGYVLLIGMVIVMGGIVYAWLKTYVPKDIAQCPNEISISISNVQCISNQIKFTLKNTGLFNIDGYYIKATTSEEQELATEELKDGGGYFGFGRALKPNEEISLPRIIGDQIIDNYMPTYVYSIEITPMKFQENDKGILEVAVCGNSKVKESIECDIGQTLA